MEKSGIDTKLEEEYGEISNKVLTDTNGYDEYTCDCVLKQLHHEMYSMPYYVVKYVPPSEDNDYIPTISLGYKIDVTEYMLSKDDIYHIISYDKDRMHFIVKIERGWLWDVEKEYIYYIVKELRTN